MNDLVCCKRPPRPRKQVRQLYILKKEETKTITINTNRSNEGPTRSMSAIISARHNAGIRFPLADLDQGTSSGTKTHLREATRALHHLFLEVI